MFLRRIRPAFPRYPLHTHRQQPQLPVIPLPTSNNEVEETSEPKMHSQADLHSPLRQEPPLLRETRILVNQIISRLLTGLHKLTPKVMMIDRPPPDEQKMSLSPIWEVNRSAHN